MDASVTPSARLRAQRTASRLIDGDPLDVGQCSQPKEAVMPTTAAPPLSDQDVNAIHGDLACLLGWVNETLEIDGQSSD